MSPPNGDQRQLVQGPAVRSVADFAPVSLVASTPNILVVHPSTPARTVKEVIALAKAKPGTLNFAFGRHGQFLAIWAGELFRILAARYRARAVQGSGPAKAKLSVSRLSPSRAR